VLRLPMVPVSDPTRKRLEALVEELGLLQATVAQNENRRAS
jgi:hypothetical protein